LLLAPLGQFSHYQQLTHLILFIFLFDSTGEEGSGGAKGTGSGNSKDGATVKLAEITWQESLEMRQSKTRMTASIFKSTIFLITTVVVSLNVVLSVF